MQRAALSVLAIQLLLWSGIKITLSHVLSKTSPCSCIYDGGYYNLRSLASKIKGPGLVAMTDNGYQYGYNPCIPFTLEGACKNVAVCRWADSDLQSYEALGRQDNVTCVPARGDSKVLVELIFHQPGKEQKGWITTIKMKCNRTLTKPKFIIIEPAAIPVLQVEHKCCCPDACPDFTSLPKQSSSEIDYPYIIGGTVGGLFVVLLAFCGIRACYKKRKREGYVRMRGGNGGARPGGGGAGAMHGGDGGGDDGAMHGGGGGNGGGGGGGNGGARHGGGGNGGARPGGGDDGAGAMHGGDGGGDDGAMHGGGGDDGAGAMHGGGGGNGGARHGAGGAGGAAGGAGVMHGGGDDDDLVLAVEEQGHQDGEGCSPAIAIPVTEDPEDQCPSDEDDVEIRSPSCPVEHEEARK